MPRKILRKKDEKIPTYKEMTEAWWSIYNAFEHIRQGQIRDYLTRISFEALLAQCGWTIEEWNSITNTDQRP